MNKQRLILHTKIKGSLKNYVKEIYRRTQQQYMALGLILVNRKTFFDEKTSIVCVDLQVPSNNTNIYIHMCVLFNF